MNRAIVPALLGLLLAAPLGAANALHIARLPLSTCEVAEDVQGDRKPRRPRQGQLDAPMQEGGRMERIKAARRSFYTEKLDLTVAEAEKFWPLFGQHEKEMMELHKARRLQRFEAAESGISSLSNAEADKLIDSELDFKDKETALNRKYLVQYRKVLTPQKVAVLLTLEERFKRELLHRLREGRGGR